MPTLEAYSEAKKREIKAKLKGRVRNAFAVLNSIENRRGAEFAEDGEDVAKLCRAVKADTGEDVPQDLMREILGLADREDFSEDEVVDQVDGEFCLFTAESEGKVKNPDGTERDAWTQDRLQTVADNFGDEGRIAKEQPRLALKNPIVIGHEEDSEFMKRTDTPSCGWIGSLRMAGDKLMAGFKDMPRKVAGWIKRGTFSTRSPEFYPDYHGFGGTLRRVALLGGQLPAKKDLGDTVFFAEDEPEFVIAFQEAPRMTLGEMIAAVAGMDETARRALIEKIAAETGSTVDVVVKWLTTDPAELPGVVQDGIKRALGIDQAEAEDDEATEGDEAAAEEKPPAEGSPEEDSNTHKDEKEIEDMAEKKKSKQDLEARIAELETVRKADLEAFSEKAKAAREKLEGELSRAHIRLDEKDQALKVKEFETFADKMHDTGKYPGPGRKAAIVDALKKISGVEKFSEGQAPKPEDVLMGLLDEVALPVDTTGRVLSDEVHKPDQAATFAEIDKDRDEWKAHVKNTGSDVSFEMWAEADHDADVVASYMKKKGLKRADAQE